MAEHCERRPPGAAGRQPAASEASPLAVAVGLDGDTTELLARAATERRFRWQVVPSLAELAGRRERADVAFVAAGQCTGSDGADGLAREVVVLFDPDHGGPGPAAWFAAHHRHMLFKPLHPGFVSGLFDELASELTRFQPDGPAAVPLDRLGPLIGSSPVMVEFKQRLLRLAGNGAGVLVYGETGTEREQAARLMHRTSPRRLGPLVQVDGAAWWRDGSAGEGLRDAARWTRRLEAAAGGSLLLGRVADLAEAAQMALCRELAGRSAASVDVRLLATTDAQPLAAIADGRLCRALYWHVARFVLRVPPLRERGGDVVGLAVRRLQVLNRRHHTDRRLDAGAREVLLDHAWPGNLQELAQAVDRAHAAAHAGIDRELMISAIHVGQALADGESG
jgi:DNA-binding NtrC family response regulator